MKEVSLLAVKVCTKLIKQQIGTVHINSVPKPNQKSQIRAGDRMMVERKS